MSSLAGRTNVLCQKCFWERQLRFEHLEDYRSKIMTTTLIIPYGKTRSSECGFVCLSFRFGSVSDYYDTHFSRLQCVKSYTRNGSLTWTVSHFLKDALKFGDPYSPGLLGIVKVENPFQCWNFLPSVDSCWSRHLCPSRSRHALLLTSRWWSSTPPAAFMRTRWVHGSTWCLMRWWW